MINDWIRRTGFWILDALKGGNIKKNYIEVKHLMDNKILNIDQIDVLLNHAVQNVPYYKNYNPTKFYDFPVINKNTLKENWDLMHAKNYLGTPLHYMSTSGSTGTPFTMEWDMRKRQRQLAELIYFNEIADQKLGQKYVYFRVWTDANKKSKLQSWMQNLIPIDILHLDDENLEYIRNRLKRRPYINSCLGYASTYVNLIKYIQHCDDTPDMYHMKTLFSSSEVLGMNMKKIIKDTLGCKIIDRYSNEENGFLAQSDDLSDEFIVNTSGFKIELLKYDSDDPVELGECGRIVVTDLYNFALPLIRYDTGDLAIGKAESEGWMTVLKTIQGRSVDMIFDTKGNKLTPHTLSVYMWKYPKLKQYQFIQKTHKTYILKINVAIGVYDDNEIIAYLKDIFGADAEIIIEYVSGIPIVQSGKFKKCICELE